MDKLSISSSTSTNDDSTYTNSISPSIFNNTNNLVTSTNCTDTDKKINSISGFVKWKLPPLGCSVFAAPKTDLEEDVEKRNQD